MRERELPQAGAVGYRGALLELLDVRERVGLLPLRLAVGAQEVERAGAEPIVVDLPFKPRRRGGQLRGSSAQCSSVKRTSSQSAPRNFTKHGSCRSGSPRDHRSCAPMTSKNEVLRFSIHFNHIKPSLHDDLVVGWMTPNGVHVFKWNANDQESAGLSVTKSKCKSCMARCGGLVPGKVFPQEPRLRRIRAI